MLHVQRTVKHVLQPINASIVKTTSILTVVHAMPHALQEPLQTKINSNAFHVTVHAEHVLTTQVHAQAVNQEQDIFRLLPMNKNV